MARVGWRESAGEMLRFRILIISIRQHAYSVRTTLRKHWIDVRRSLKLILTISTLSSMVESAFTTLKSIREQSNTLVVCEILIFQISPINLANKRLCTFTCYSCLMTQVYIRISANANPFGVIHYTFRIHIFRE